MREQGFIKGYPPGSNITVLNVIYIRPQKTPEGKYTNGSIYIIFKDLDTGEKKFQFIDNPEYVYYISNGEKDINTNMVFIDERYVKPVVCKYKDLRKSIAEQTNNLDFYYDNIKSGNFKNNDKLLTIPTIFRADMHIEDYYRYEFARMYQNNEYALTKMYLDIEVNTEEIDGDFPDPGQCTVNAVSLVDYNGKQVYTLLLKDPTNPQIEEFEKNKNITKELKDFVITSVGGSEKESLFGLVGMKYNIIFFDKEIDLITSIFNIINMIKPDFVLAWNMKFDIPYLIARLSKLGVTPATVICHKDFPIKRCFYYIDHRTEIFAERGDFADIVSYTVYLDQLITFASRRKGQAAVSSFKLDHIGQLVAGVRKLDYSNITYSLCKLPRLDYKTFVFYNVMDTIVQACIESRSGDVEFVFNKARTNNTRYSKVHRQTVYITNRANQEYASIGYILGNNTNKSNSGTESYSGGFVQDPELVTDNLKEKINGRSIDIARNLNDFDFSSLYPSIIHQYNIGHNTMMGKLIFDEQMDPMENRFNNPIYNRSRWFIEDLVSQDYLDFCQRYLGLPSYEEMYHLIEQYFREVKNPVRGTRIDNPMSGKKVMYRRINNNQNRQMYTLIDEKPDMLINLHRRPSRDGYNNPNQ